MENENPKNQMLKVVMNDWGILKVATLSRNARTWRDMAIDDANIIWNINSLHLNDSSSIFPPSSFKFEFYVSYVIEHVDPHALYCPKERPPYVFKNIDADGIDVSDQDLGEAEKEFYAKDGQ